MTVFNPRTSYELLSLSFEDVSRRLRKVKYFPTRSHCSKMMEAKFKPKSISTKAGTLLRTQVLCY